MGCHGQLGLVDFILYLLDGQVNVLGKNVFKKIKLINFTCENFFSLLKMTSGLVYPGYSLPESSQLERNHLVLGALSDLFQEASVLWGQSPEMASSMPQILRSGFHSHFQGVIITPIVALIELLTMELLVLELFWLQNGVIYPCSGVKLTSDKELFLKSSFNSKRELNSTPHES